MQTNMNDRAVVLEEIVLSWLKGADSEEVKRCVEAALMDEAVVSPQLNKALERCRANCAEDVLSGLVVELLPFCSPSLSWYSEAVAKAVQDHAMSLYDAALLLKKVPNLVRDELGSEQQNAIYVAELVLMDAKEGFMSVDDDDMLKNALERLLSRRA